jgi:hypothetical protein
MFKSHMRILKNYHLGLAQKNLYREFPFVFSLPTTERIYGP